MFEIGFWELILVGLVALLVFGPERLPRVARETALWLRRARTMLSSVKAEIDQELQLQELKQSVIDKKEFIDRQENLRITTDSVAGRLSGNQSLDTRDVVHTNQKKVNEA